MKEILEEDMYELDATDRDDIMKLVSRLRVIQRNIEDDPELERFYSIF